jgi:hypothetical protein
MYEVFDLNEAYIKMLFEKLLLRSISLMKMKSIHMKANLKSRKFHLNLCGKKYTKHAVFYERFWFDFLQVLFF